MKVYLAAALELSIILHDLHQHVVYAVFKVKRETQRDDDDHDQVLLKNGNLNFFEISMTAPSAEEDHVISSKAPERLN